MEVDVVSGKVWFVLVSILQILQHVLAVLELHRFCFFLNGPVCCSLRQWLPPCFHAEATRLLRSGRS